MRRFWVWIEARIEAMVSEALEAARLGEWPEGDEDA
jgi:hypothetical protein